MRNPEQSLAKSRVCLIKALSFQMITVVWHVLTYMRNLFQGCRVPCTWRPLGLPWRAHRSRNPILPRYWTRIHRSEPRWEHRLCGSSGKKIRMSNVARSTDLPKSSTLVRPGNAGPSITWTQPKWLKSLAILDPLIRVWQSWALEGWKRGSLESCIARPSTQILVSPGSKWRSSIAWPSLKCFDKWMLLLTKPALYFSGWIGILYRSRKAAMNFFNM